MWKVSGFVIMLSCLAACNLSTPGTVVPTVQPTRAASATSVATQTPTATATASATFTATATVTQTPTVTQTASVTPTPSITPMPDHLLRVDRLELVDLPDFLRDGVNEPYILFANSNDQESIRNIATGEPENTTQIVYASEARNQRRTALLTLQSSQGNRFYPAPQGKGFAYFVVNDNPGLYIMNIMPIGEASFSARIWQTSNLVQAGLLSEPVWTADGEQLAVTQAIGYGLDIVLYSRDTRARVNLTNSPTYDMYPSFSPDGRYMAFVSDRTICASWNPADADFCDATVQAHPIGGTVHLLDLASGDIRQVSDEFVVEAPRWINSQQLVIAAGDKNDLLNPRRQLWLADVNQDTVMPVLLAGDDDSNLYLSDAWSPDGQQVIFQRVTGNATEIVLMNTADGIVIRRRSDDLVFSRFGAVLAWSSVDDRIAIGGVGGRCPYGIRVADETFDWVATGNVPTICDPSFSASGDLLVYTGVTSEVDGRLDIYSATNNGFGQVNLTVDLLGSNLLIGWLEP